MCGRPVNASPGRLPKDGGPPHLGNNHSLGYVGTVVGLASDA